MAEPTPWPRTIRDPGTGVYRHCGTVITVDADGAATEDGDDDVVILEIKVLIGEADTIEISAPGFVVSAAGSPEDLVATDAILAMPYARELRDALTEILDWTPPDGSP